MTTKTISDRVAVMKVTAKMRGKWTASRVVSRVQEVYGVAVTERTVRGIFSKLSAMSPARVKREPLHRGETWWTHAPGGPRMIQETIGSLLEYDPETIEAL